MSYTSIWVIDKNWSGKEYSVYKNSYLFPPIIWDILMCKYISEYERLGYDFKPMKNFLIWTAVLSDNEERNRRFSLLNDRINKSDIQYDRVLWELANLSVFNAKDKSFVADCIEMFVENNFDTSEYKDSEHIKERFHEVARDIRALPTRCKFFVIHPTSCDDAVEWWFNGHRLSYWDMFVCEFTIIESNKVVGFSDNLLMCRRKKDEN